jgi:predicted nucleic acid-binding protein
VSSLYVADTNIYVGAAHDAAFQAQFEGFVQEHGALLVSSVVVAEVLIGIPDAARHAEAVAALASGTQLLAPTSEDWVKAGEVTAKLGGEAITKSRSFWNDTLLAAQCGRLSAALITRNVRDFQRLRRYSGVEVVTPFPRRTS